MVRGGHMFAPNKTWRRWHRKINLKQKRFAVVGARSASLRLSRPPAGTACQLRWAPRLVPAALPGVWS